MVVITITGNIGLPNGEPHVGNVTFTPLRTPMFNGTTAVFTMPITVATDDTGDFSQVLEPGIYIVDCVVGGRVARNPIRSFQVQVPNRDTDEEIPFSSLRRMTEVYEAADFGGSTTAGGSEGPATTTTAGIVRIDQSDADPVVMTKKSFTGTDGLGFLARPVAGKLYIKDSITGLYHEVLCQTVGGFPALGIQQVGVAFASLPSA